MTCPHCQADARCKGFRRRTALTLLGKGGSFRGVGQERVESLGE